MSTLVESIPGVMPRSDRAPLALHRFAVFTSACTLFLLFAGAMVKSTGSGLAVPDWPLSYGQVMPPMVGGVFYEHGHRMVASFVGCLMTVLACWLVHSEPRTWVRRVGLAAMAAVVVQGLLGGLTVLLKLPPQVSIAHAGLAQVFFALTISLAFFTGPRWAAAERRPAASREVARLRTVFIVTAATCYVQILLGALVRHFGAGLSIPDFPLAYGKVIPKIDSFYVGIHFAHRVGALCVTAAIVYATLTVKRSALTAGVASIQRTAGLLALALAAQLTLGAYVIWSERAVEMTSTHLVMGAVTWGLAVSQVLLSFRDLPASGEVAA